MKILLLEDEVMLRHSIAEFLETFGNSVHGFGQGDEALAIIEKESFDLFILDINVPCANGYEVIEAIRKRFKMTPVIFISALHDIDDLTKAYELGCTEYMKKPFKLRELKLRIDTIFRLIGFSGLSVIPLGKGYSFDKKNKKLFYNGTEEALTKKHLELMALLVENLDNIVTNDMFRVYAWGRDDIDDATIRAEINRLKKTLKEDIILNLKGLGYKIAK